MNNIDWNMIAQPGFNRPRGGGKTLKLMLHLLTSLEPNKVHFYVCPNPNWHYNKFLDILKGLNVDFHFKNGDFGMHIVRIHDAKVRFVHAMPNEHELRGIQFKSINDTHYTRPHSWVKKHFEYPVRPERVVDKEAWIQGTWKVDDEPDTDNCG